MLSAERRAATTGKPLADDAQPMVSRGFTNLEAPEGISHRARNAVIPIGLLVVLTITLIYYIGLRNTAPEDLENLPGGVLEQIRTVLFWGSRVLLVTENRGALSGPCSPIQRLQIPTCGGTTRSCRSMGRKSSDSTIFNC